MFSPVPKAVGNYGVVSRKQTDLLQLQCSNLHALAASDLLQPNESVAERCFVVL